MAASLYRWLVEPQAAASLPAAALWVGFAIAVVTAVVAVATYVTNSLERRRAQARLVYAKIIHLQDYEVGDDVSYELDFGALTIVTEPGAVAQYLRPHPSRTGVVLTGRTLRTAVRVAVEIRNESDELLLGWWPALYDYGLKRHYLGILRDALPPVEPRASAVLILIAVNPHGAGTSPGLSVDIAFRDSVGRTWQRRQGAPIESPRKWSTRLVRRLPAPWQDTR